MEAHRKLFSWRHLGAWLRSVVVWLTTPRLGWMTVLVVLGSFAAPWVASEFWLRTLGLALQLLGVGTVAWGVRDARKLFQGRTLWESLRAWLSERPRWPRHVMLNVQGMSIATSMGSARLHVWSALNQHDPVLAQLSALMRNVETLKNELHELHATLDTKFGAQSTAIERETAQRRSEDEALREQLRRAQTGGLHITSFGLVCLACGLVLATLSPDIVKWFR